MTYPVREQAGGMAVQLWNEPAVIQISGIEFAWHFVTVPFPLAAVAIDDSSCLFRHDIGNDNQNSSCSSDITNIPGGFLSSFSLNKIWAALSPLRSSTVFCLSRKKKWNIWDKGIHIPILGGRRGKTFVAQFRPYPNCRDTYGFQFNLTVLRRDTKISW